MIFRTAPTLLALALLTAAAARAAAPSAKASALPKEPVAFLQDLSDVHWNWIPMEERLQRAVPVLLDACRAGTPYDCSVPPWFEEVWSKFQEEGKVNPPAAANAFAARVCAVALEAGAATGKPANEFMGEGWQLTARDWCPLAFANGHTAFHAIVYLRPGERTTVLLAEFSLLYCNRAAEKAPRACELYLEKGQDGLLSAATKSPLPLLAGVLGLAASVDGNADGAARLESAITRWGKQLFGTPAPRKPRAVAQAQQDVVAATGEPASQAKRLWPLLELAQALDEAHRSKEAAQAWEKLAAALEKPAEATSDYEELDRARAYLELAVALKRAKKADAAAAAFAASKDWARRYAEADLRLTAKLERLPCDEDSCLEVAEEVLVPGRGFQWIEPARRTEQARAILEASCARYPKTCERARARLEELKAPSGQPKAPAGGRP